MCNANAEILNLVQTRQEYKRMLEEAKAMVETLDDQIKAYMTAMNSDSMMAGAFKVTWQESTRNTVDTTALKRAMPDIAAQFTKAQTVRTFKVA